MAETAAREAHHVHADSGLTDERSRVLKHADTFVLFDERGDIRSSQWGESGLYHDGTRHLSRFQLELDGARPFLLSSTVRDDNDQLVVALTNPDLYRQGRVCLSMGSLHLAWRKLLWMGVLYQELRIENHATKAAEFSIATQFAADFADIYEVRGMRRRARGYDLEPELTDGIVQLSYRGLDAVIRRTVLRFTPRPDRLTPSRAVFEIALAAGEAACFYVDAACERESVARPLLSFDAARSEVRADFDAQVAQYARIESDNAQFNALIRRTIADLHMLTTMLLTGPYPYAGVPWFNTPFGRDGIVTALECLWLNPALARGVLAYLACTQATEVIPAQDAEPGKILHETRRGEMAVMGEMPFAQYYGSVDATPLFVVLAGAYYERTGDLTFIAEIWPNIEAALRWMIDCGDRDGDGFIEYQSQGGDGLLNQGWKDSDDAIFHADGSLPRLPVAVCEVQGYAYAAWQAGAVMAAALDRPEASAEFSRRAGVLRERFEDAFWCEELSLYAVALDGAGQPCRVRTSNPGHCLYSGIVGANRARRVADALLSVESFSGWGVRTVAAGEPRYNPMGYHTGTVWPHDNAIIARGLTRYGLAAHASRIFTGLFDAAMYCDLHRLPELFCGFPRQAGEGPVMYPVACAPQAWSAAAVFLLLEGALGIRVNALERRISFVRPWLPPFLSEVRILNLTVCDAAADILVVRHEQDISVNVLRERGAVEVVVLP
jgi:glycogen debranching enzyme